MTKVRHEICAIVGRYTDRDGKEKNRYQKVGVELETEGLSCSRFSIRARKGKEGLLPDLVSLASDIFGKAA